MNNKINLELYKDSEIDKKYTSEVDGYVYDLDFIRKVNSLIETPEASKKYNALWNMWSPAFEKDLTFTAPDGDGDERILKHNVEFNLYITNKFVDERDLRHDYQMILEICQHENINLNVQHFKGNTPIDKLHPLLRKGKPVDQRVFESQIEDIIDEMEK